MCPACDGSGWRQYVEPQFYVFKPCDCCQGTGRLSPDQGRALWRDWRWKHQDRNWDQYDRRIRRELAEVPF